MHKGQGETWAEYTNANQVCHPEKSKNQAAKLRRFCFVQDLFEISQICHDSKILKQVQDDTCVLLLK